MKSVLLPLLAWICFSTVAWSQTTFQVTIKDADNKQPLVGAHVILEGTTMGGNAKLDGFVEIQNIPAGKQKIIFSYIGYEERFEIFNFPLSQSEFLEILLYIHAEEMEEITVSVTRSSRTMSDIPTCV